MIFTIKITEAAKEDMRDIYRYIAFNFMSPQTAARQIDKLEKAILSLDNMPMRFKRYETEPWHSKGLRSMPVGNFVVLYIPNEETRVVTIFHVMYGGRDIDEQLKNEDV